MPTRKVNAYPNDSRVLDVRFYYDLEQMRAMGTPFFKSLHVNAPLYTGARVKMSFSLVRFPLTTTQLKPNFYHERE